MARVMMESFIVDSHVHTGFISSFFSPETGVAELVKLMDSLSIRFAINCGDARSLLQGAPGNLEGMRRGYEESQGRVFYLGVFDPGNGDACLKSLEKALSWPGFKGIKMHPSFHQRPADDPAYEPAWKLASDARLTIIAHSWSVSTYNPAQALSTPGRYERWVARFQEVRLVLAHSGGRGTGQREAIRLANSYENVYMDCAGDPNTYRYFEVMAKAVPEGRVLFGSDWPWMDPRAHLSRIYLSEIDRGFKRKVLRDNARAVFNIEDAAAG